MSVNISSYTVCPLVRFDVQAAWAVYGGTYIRIHMYVCVYIYPCMYIYTWWYVRMFVYVYVRTVCTVKYAVVVFSVCSMSLSGCAGWMCGYYLKLLPFRDIILANLSNTRLVSKVVSIPHFYVPRDIDRSCELVCQGTCKDISSPKDIPWLVTCCGLLSPLSIPVGVRVWLGHPLHGFTPRLPHWLGLYSVVMKPQ